MSDEGFDINALLNQAMAMQQQMAEAQNRPRASRFRRPSRGGAVAGDETGGAVKVTRVSISMSAAVDPSDVEMLEDLGAGRVHDAQDESGEVRRAARSAR